MTFTAHTRREFRTSEAPARRQRGQALVEATLMLPWIIFLFIGTVDFGFYGYALINTQNAARVAAMQTSASSSTATDSTLACTYVLSEMQALPNLSGASSCAALPLTVTAASVPAASSADGSLATQVSVTYQTPQLIPFLSMMGQLTVTRTVQMRVKGS